MVRQPVPVIGHRDRRVPLRLPGFLLGLATKEASLSYWDYQFRVDGGNPRNGWTVFAFGARDDARDGGARRRPDGPIHRSSRRSSSASTGSTCASTTGAGATTAPTAWSPASTARSAPAPTSRCRWPSRPPAGQWKQDERLTLVGGLDGTFRDVDQGGRGALSTARTTTSTSASITDEIDRLYGGGALTEALWRPTSRWLIRPGVRGDVWHDGDTTKGSVDPRLSAATSSPCATCRTCAPTATRARSGSRAASASSISRRASSCRCPGSTPCRCASGSCAPSSRARRRGAVRHQMSLGAEGFFNYMDPTIFDLAVNQQDLNEAANDALFPGTTEPSPERRAGDHRPPAVAADRTRLRARAAGAPPVGDGPVRLAVVHAVARRAEARRRVGALRLRPQPPPQPGGRAAPAAQLGLRRAPPVPERQAGDDDVRLQRRAHRRLRRASTCASTSAPSGATGCSTSTWTSSTSRSCRRRSPPARRSSTSCPPSGCAGGSEPWRAR